MTNPYMSQQNAKTSGGAVASLVLGVMGVMCGPFTSIPAIIIGALAIKEVRNSGGTLSGDGLAIAGIVTGAVTMILSFFTLGLVAAITLPALSRAREAANRAVCQNNLKQIGIEIKMYQGEHGGQYPTTLSDLAPYTTDPTIFICPNDANKVPGDPASAAEWSSYAYTPAAADDNGSSTPIMQDNDPARHIPFGQNVLFADGHVEYRKAGPNSVNFGNAPVPATP